MPQTDSVIAGCNNKDEKVENGDLTTYQFRLGQSSPTQCNTSHRHQAAAQERWYFGSDSGTS